MLVEQTGRKIKKKKSNTAGCYNCYKTCGQYLPYVSRVSDSAGRLQQVQDQDFSLVLPLTSKLLIGRFTGIYPVAVHVYGLREIWREPDQGENESWCSSWSYYKKISGTMTGALDINTGKNCQCLLEKKSPVDSRNPLASSWSISYQK